MSAPSKDQVASATLLAVDWVGEAERSRSLDTLKHANDTVIEARSVFRAFRSSLSENERDEHEPFLQHQLEVIVGLEGKMKEILPTEATTPGQDPGAVM